MLCVDDLWTSDQPLPGGATLGQMARRILEIWGAGQWADRVRIGYNARLRTTLGRAFLAHGRVELSAHLLREHPQELVATLAHELAHLVVHGRDELATPHGAEFRLLMRLAGLSPSATHRLPIARRPRRRFVYVHCCSGCGYTFAARSVRRNRYCAACGPGMRWRIVRLPGGDRQPSGCA